MKARFIEKFLKEAGIPYRHRKIRKLILAYPGEDREISITVSDKTVSLAGDERSFQTFCDFLLSAGFTDIAQKAVAFESDSVVKSYDQLISNVLNNLTFWGWIENMKYRKLINFISYRKHEFFDNIYNQYVNRKKHYNTIIKAFKMDKRIRNKASQSISLEDAPKSKNQ